MCERCEKVNGEQEEIALLVPLMHSDRTDEQIQAAADGLKNFTAEQFSEMGLMDLASLIAVRLAVSVSYIEDIPPHIILGVWAGRMLEAQEMANATNEVAEMLASLFAGAGNLN